MTAAEIKKLLEEYTTCKAVVRYNLTNLAMLQEEYNNHKRQYIEPEEEMIEGMCLSSPVLSDIPRSITNKFNSKTENAAIADRETVHDNEFDVQELLLQMNRIREHIAPYEAKINTIESLWEYLPERERFVLHNRYVLQLSHEDIVIRHINIYRYGTRQTIYNTETTAINRMSKISDNKPKGA